MEGGEQVQVDPVKIHFMNALNKANKFDLYSSRSYHATNHPMQSRPERRAGINKKG
jgi:hypothetical protein